MQTDETSRAMTDRIYGYVPKRQCWLINVCDDKGLAALMVAQGAQRIETMRNGVKREYWSLPGAAFGQIKAQLDILGYVDNAAASKTPEPTTSYRVPVTRSEATALQRPTVHTYTIKELGGLIRDVIQKGISGDIWVQGELFDVSKLSETRWFFGTLVDSAKVGASGRPEADHRLKIVIWGEHWGPIRQQIQAQKLPSLEPGTKVRMRGKLDYSSRYGQPQLVVEEIDPLFTEGEIYKQKRLIVEKLQAMGIAHLNKQLPMPILPLRLAVFSSIETAGYRDFKNKLMESGFPFQITFFQVRVQGKELEPMFLTAFQQLETLGYDAFDLGLILRGGGSMLDLEGFNNLRLGEYVARCPLKFLIAIGHERDKSVLDEIAEYGITPTDAGILLVKRVQSLVDFLQTSSANIAHYSRQHLQNRRNDLCLTSSELSRYVIQAKASADSILTQEIQKLEKAVLHTQAQALKNLQQLESALSHQVHQRIQSESHHLVHQAMNVTHQVENIRAETRHTLTTLTSDLRNTVQNKIQSENQRLAYQSTRICDRIQMQRMQAQSELDRFKDTLKCLDPSDLYRRGFVTLRNAEGKPVRSLQDIAIGQNLNIRMVDGQIGVTVDSCSPDMPDHVTKPCAK